MGIIVSKIMSLLLNSNPVYCLLQPNARYNASAEVAFFLQVVHREISSSLEAKCFKNATVAHAYLFP